MISSLFFRCSVSSFLFVRIDIISGVCLLNSPLFRKDYKIAPRNDIFDGLFLSIYLSCDCCLCGTSVSKHNICSVTCEWNVLFFCLLHSVSSEWVYGSNRSVWENRCQAESWNLSSWHYYLWNWTKTTHCSLLSRNLFYSLGRRIDGESGRVHGGKAKTTNASWRWLEWCERPKAIKIYGWKILQNHCTFSRCHSEVVFYYFWRSSVVVVLPWLIKLLRQIDFNFFQLQPQLRTDQQKNMRNCNVKSQFAWPHRTQMVMVGHF